MSAQLIGQYDPAMTAYMNETMALYRGVFDTGNEATLVVDGTSRAGIEAALVSLIEPGDRVLVPIFGRFGHLLREIAERCGAEVHVIETEWGTVFTPEQIEAAIAQTRPKLLAIVHGDTSTTLAQPLDELGEICRRHGVLFYTDVIASLAGNEFHLDAWGVDAVTAGLQKCLAGPSGSAPISLSPRAVEVITARKSIEAGIRSPGDPVNAAPIRSNYLDLAMVLDYWGEKRLNHHTEATSRLYCARECARLLVEEGMANAVERHRVHGTAMVEGLTGLGLTLFGDQSHRMNNVVGVEIPDGIDGDGARSAMLGRRGQHPRRCRMTEPSGAPDEAALIMERCDELATLSRSAEHLERVHLSPEHAAANTMVAGWMIEAGLSTWQDAAGNQCGRLEGATPGLPALLLGSHIDTVPDAGRYDGILGVLLAIAVAARVARSGWVLPFALEVVAFSDEEGTRFGTALLGSRALAGTWDKAWWDLTDADGITLYEAFQDFGLDPARLPGAFRRREQLVGYLEAHIEQGRVLDDTDRALAVVTSIAGARRFSLEMTGMAGHAGGTPLELRHDALVGASELVVAVEALSKAHRTIGTVGRLQAFPGGVNVIPGRVEFSLDLRAETDAARDGCWQEIHQAAAEISSRRGLSFEATEIYRADAVRCGLALRRAVSVGIRSTGDGDPLAFYSRAGHDGVAVSAVTEFGMLFVRCAAGVSHHPDESVREQDVAVALDAFEAAVRELAAQHAAPAAP